MYVSLCFLGYVASVRPFDSKILNFLEVLNEFVILGCLYHLLIFTETMTDNRDTLYDLGWGMNLLLVIQLVINVKMIGYQTAVGLWNIMKRAYIKAKAKIEHE
jgi:hypothetical protein